MICNHQRIDGGKNYLQSRILYLTPSGQGPEICVPVLLCLLHIVDIKEIKLYFSATDIVVSTEYSELCLFHHTRVQTFFCYHITVNENDVSSHF